MQKQTIAGWMAAAISAGSLQTGSGETTPRRPLSTDRPDTTESPYTVDEGRFQIEMEIASMTMDGGEKSHSLGEMNLKFGLDERTDIQFVMPLHTSVAGGAEGYGDIQIRLKRNLWGNDGGSTAFAVMPYIQLPTGASGIGVDDAQGGIIFPFAIEGTHGWGYGLQAQFDIGADPDGSGHNASFLISATAARELSERMGAFFELVAIVGEGSAASSEQYFNTGLTWAVSETVQLDGGVRIGLANDAEDFSPFLGISAKF